MDPATTAQAEPTHPQLVTTSELQSLNGSRHQTYYMETITFKVEGCLFKVPRHNLEHRSQIFGTASTLPSGDETAEGQSDEKPVELEGVERVDFQALMKALYPLDLQQIYKNKDAWMTKEEWVSVLKLASKWFFVDLRELAIYALSNRDDVQSVERIVWGRQYDVPDWLRKGYTELGCRPDSSITEDEARIIGWEAAFRLIQARESAMRGYHGWDSYSLQSVSQYIESTFSDEFRQTELASSDF
ncbi:hypothetical protein R3P38DRAFT_3269706 [Favolaschia claudopus]|uniref:BTB domain-containing protein n=1 Tax=Favolaschia claudopus TaxID=2862362 RepID=A0AAW0BF85_9AGAR